MKIQGDLATVYSLANDPAPEGITVERSSGGATKAINLNVNVTVDLGTITGFVASSWILARAIASVRRGSNVNVNGQRLPSDEAGTRKIIMDAIDAEQNNDSDGN